MARRLAVQVPQLMRKLLMFEEFTDAELELLSVLFQPVSYSAGEIIYREGDPGSFLVIVVSGSVGTYQGTDPAKGERLELVSTGALLGNVCVIDGGPRLTTTKAEIDCIALRGDRADFQRLFDAKSRFVYKLLDVILKDLSGRIREADEALEKIVAREDPNLEQLLSAAHMVKTAVGKATDTQRIYRMRQKQYQ